MAFQRGAFQEGAFQMDDPPSGGSGAKLDSEAYAYVYNQADRLRRRIEELPEPVQAVIEQALEVPKKADRAQIVTDRLDNIDLKFRRLYLAILEEYCSCLLDQQLTIELQLAEQNRRRKDDELAIMLLLL